MTDTPEHEPPPPATEAAGASERESAGKSTARGGLQVTEVVGSVFAAALGVQSSRNRERDFRQGRAATFIVAGIVFTALFIGAVYTVVSLVLAGR